MAIIGIDLGTTNSLVAVWKNGAARIIPNALGKSLTPSAVSVLEDGTLLVGQSAKERCITTPQSTALTFKRTMGQKFFYQLNDKNFTSTELSAIVLASLKRDAEQYLGEEVTEAVISVPAYFNQHQRKATKEAGRIAGLKVERLVSEPTAAALCYGINEKPDMNNALVLDLGGGTFDVSVLEFFEGIIDVKAVSGDNHLGGEDFTHAVAAWFLYANGITQKLSVEENAALNKASEIAKYAVSDRINPHDTNISVTIAGKSYSSVLTPALFKEITADLLERIKKPIKKALLDAGLKSREIDAVILMGGATRMSIVTDFAQSVFGQRVITSYNPDETVALGAAVIAALKEHNQALKETVLTDICPFTLSTDSISGETNNLKAKPDIICVPLIERNTPVPVSIVKRFYTVRKGQTKVNVGVFQGESLKPEENVNLGTLEVAVPENYDDYEDIDIRFTYDINGLLEVEVKVVSTGDTKKLLINQAGSDLTEDEIKAAQEKMNELKILPWEEEENRAILERGMRLYEETIGNVREQVAMLINQFEAALNTQNAEIIRKTATMLTKFFDSIEGEEAW